MRRRWRRGLAKELGRRVGAREGFARRVQAWGSIRARLGREEADACAAGGGAGFACTVERGSGCTQSIGFDGSGG